MNDYKYKISCNHASDCEHEFTEINKFLKNKIGELFIKCKFSFQGCMKIIKVSQIEKHEQNCEYCTMIW